MSDQVTIVTDGTGFDNGGDPEAWFNIYAHDNSTGKDVFIGNTVKLPFTERGTLLEPGTVISRGVEIENRAGVSPTKAYAEGQLIELPSAADAVVTLTVTPARK